MKSIGSIISGAFNCFIYSENQDSSGYSYESYGLVPKATSGLVHEPNAMELVLG